MLERWGIKVTNYESFDNHKGVSLLFPYPVTNVKQKRKMLISRGTSTIRSLRKLTASSNKVINAVRNSHVWFYRGPPPPPPKFHLVIAEATAGAAWWWVLWHLWTEPDHILGEFTYPDSHKWTDEELGIPAC